MIVHSEGLMSLDEYLYARVHVIRQSQILISEKFLFIGSKRAVVSKLEDDSEKWSKSVIKLTKAQKSLLFEERKKECHSFSQETCAAEIRSASGRTCRLNQSVVSKMLKGQYMPKEGEKAVRYWVMNEKRKKHIQKTGEDPVETVILYDNESTDNEQYVVYKAFLSR